MKAERLLLLASKFLDMGAEEYSNHGCNDCDLRHFGLNDAEMEELIRAHGEWNGDLADEIEADVKRLPHTTDWTMMYTVAHLLKKLACQST